MATSCNATAAIYWNRAGAPSDVYYISFTVSSSTGPLKQNLDFLRDELQSRRDVENVRTVVTYSGFP